MAKYVRQMGTVMKATKYVVLVTLKSACVMLILPEKAMHAKVNNPGSTQTVLILICTPCA